MAKLKIVQYEDETLRKVCRPVEAVTPRVCRLLDDMLETMRNANGCGLAGPQVGVLRRIAVVEVEEGKPIELINPKIVAYAGEQREEEGCLSIPGRWGVTVRPKYVTVRATDRNGKEFEVQGSDLLARALCHEIDHLDGRLFIDRLAPEQPQEKKKMRILFMGTPDFAVFALRALIETGEDVIGVVTQPDQPRGRGYVLTPPPVKVCAEENGIPVYQPEKLKTQEFSDLLFELDPELIVVAAYGKILPAAVLDYPACGCINIHGSLLPEYRGAAPIQRAIMDGKTVTGITTMMMDVGLDTGDILLTGEVKIEPEDNFETVHDKMGTCGAEVLLRTLAALRNGTLRRIPQDGSRSTYAAKIEKSDCILHFSDTAESLHNRIRALSPFPLAFTHLPNGKLLKITEARVSERKKNGDVPAGTVIATDGGNISVACGTGVLDLLGVLPEGKGRMTAAAFLNGHGVKTGDLLGGND